MIDWDSIFKLISLDTNIEKTKNSFKEAGIDIVDDDGNLKSLYNILEELSDKYNDVSL